MQRRQSSREHTLQYEARRAQNRSRLTMPQHGNALVFFWMVLMSGCGGPGSPAPVVGQAGLLFFQSRKPASSDVRSQRSC